MALFQTYWEIRWAKTDAEIEEQLAGQERVNVDFSERRFQFGRHPVEHDMIFAQVWGARLIGVPRDLPITSDPLDNEGLLWPGFEGPITNRMADALGVLDYVYVDDAVLADFEGRREFIIHPESGSVTHGTQWGVSFCDRVGKNLIRLEVRKLYEGAPAHIIRYWHKFAVPPPPTSAFPAILEKPNIAKRAKAITFAVAELGDALSALARRVGLSGLAPADLVGLNEPDLRYMGWWRWDVTEKVARHVPLRLSSDGFVDRCMNLDQLMVEGLSEESLRKLLHAMQVPAKDMSDFRTLIPTLIDQNLCAHWRKPMDMMVQV